ncbi:nuclear division Rft1 protein [Aspergillus niger CBS 101883]|uniref:nuclear division Rft1 protein n=1 Tax=Aspergillus lacticoffeatus (strain CBS 101883) TaxID=1450533 RepID=UPI0001F26EAC|nr:nuclear division Rft1 protein [Aspergillus niger CBS 101883]PYH60599.1 nuclear division Rft1 protein [Aspergillus niger CBS 101883]|eukprot:XP_001400623.2 nuclear division Rft1 protein [Aspergillus niger CBS 513.88]
MSQVDENVSAMLASSASGTTMLIVVQLASRIFTFTANQLVLRSLPPAIMGVASQLELYFISILYFSRESIRMAIQRQPLQLKPLTMVSHKDSTGTAPKKGNDVSEARNIALQSVVNMSYLSLALGFLFAMAFATSYIQLASREVSELPYYHASVIITSVASLMELSTEPFFTVVQQYMLHRQRAVVEMSAAFVKSLTTCLACAWASRTGHSIGVLPFSIGYLCYSSTLICGYILALPRVADEQKFSMFPTKIKSRSDYFMGRFSWPMIGLSTNVFFQSVVKHLLTQGDSMMLATMTSLEDQGIYALASNYGGLLARVLFQPIEESSRTLFSSLLNSGGSGNLRVENINAAKTQLTEVLRAYSLMAVVGFPLGPVLAPQLLHLLGGRIWASPRISSLLSLYCYYIPFLAYNGISEAFVSSAANSAELRRQAVWMGVFSACFASAAYLFLKVGALGAHGMVYANIVNMAVRIVWSFSFIQTFMSRHGSGIAISELSPRPLTCIASITMSIVLNSRVLYALDIYRTRDALILGAMYILLVSYLERKYLLIYYTKAHELVKFKTSSTPKSKSE